MTKALILTVCIALTRDDTRDVPVTDQYLPLWDTPLALP